MKTFRIFVSSVQDEFAEERRRLKVWLTTDLFVSRFVESVFLFEDEPSRGKPPQEVFLDEVKASDIYIGLVGSQYYGKTSVQRGVSATEQEYDAAGMVDCERWVYLKAVDKRDKKESAFVSRVNRGVTRTVFATFEDLKAAVYASFVSFLDRQELIDVGDFDKSVCREMKASDISAETVKWYLAEMALRKQKAALPLSTTADELFTRLGLMKGTSFTWAAALCFAKNPQQWSYRTTLKCAWCEGTEFGRPFLDTDKFEGNLFDLLKQGVDFVMSRIAQSRGLRTDGPQAPVRFELPREAVEEALINALVHRNWRLSASVEVRLFADRVEIWTPGALPEGITIPQLYETHSSYPVNDLVLKVFDFAGIIESLGTGIKRMIDACRASGLPDPTWEQHGHSFVVTIWKDMWTDVRLRELGLTERQKAAVHWLKVNRQLAAADYMSITHVARNTATRDLNKLVKLGVVVAEGEGKYSAYRLNRLCTIYAPYAPSSAKQNEKVDSRAFLSGKRGDGDSVKGDLQDHGGLNDAINGGIDASVVRAGQKTGLKTSLKTSLKILELLREDPNITIQRMMSITGLSRNGVKWNLAELKRTGRVRRIGPDKGGHWEVVK